MDLKNGLLRPGRGGVVNPVCLDFFARFFATEKVVTKLKVKSKLSAIPITIIIFLWMSFLRVF